MSEAALAPKFWARPVGVMCIIFGYFLLHLLVRGAFSSTLSTDEMTENVWVQDLLLGYQLRQPPLYEWLLYFVQRVLGPTIWSFMVLKYALVSVGALFLYALARRLIPDPHLSALAVFSYSAFYQVGFNLHEGVTHTAVLIAASAGFLYFFVVCLQERALKYYLLMGLWFGFGMLSKHSFYIVPAAAFLTVLSDRYWFGRLCLWRMVAAGFVALAVFAPYLYWITQGYGEPIGHIAHVMQGGNSAPFYMRVLVGESRLFLGLAGFSFPFLPLVVLLFFPAFRQKVLFVANEEHALARFFERVLVFSVLLAFLGVLLTGAQYIKERHMHPLLLVLPLVVFFRIFLIEPPRRRLRIYAGLLVAMALLAFVVRLAGFLAPDKKICGGYCRQMKPYTAFGQVLQQQIPGIGQATLVALDEYTGGNLRANFPQARVVIAHFRPRTAARSACYMIWDMGDDRNLKAVSQAYSLSGLPKMLAPEFAGHAVPLRFDVPWPHLWNSGFRRTHFGVLRLAPEDALCQ